MARSYLEAEVTGLSAVMRNLYAFADDRTIGKIVRASLAAGARIARTRGAQNARGLGLGAQRFRKDGWGHEYPTYGRIPRSIKAGKAYIPKGAPGEYRINVVARGQRQRGIFKNRAPHAHFIEYGFRTKGGRFKAPRPFLGPALRATQAQVIDKIRTTMEARVNALKFPQ